MRKRLIVGLTGLIGSGKTEVSTIFSNCGAFVIDTDIIAKDLTKINGKANDFLKTYFSHEYFNFDGSLNRQKVKELVFNNPKKKFELEAVLHSMIFDEVLKCLEVIFEGVVIIVVPLLFNSKKYLNLIDKSLFIDVDESIMIERVLKRDDIDKQLLLKIISQQMPRVEQLKLANDVIVNNSSLLDLQIKIEKQFNLYKALLDIVND